MFCIFFFHRRISENAWNLTNSAGNNRNRKKQNNRKQSQKNNFRAVSDSIISFRSPVFALTTKQERVHHPVVSTPATIQLLRNHSCSGSVLRLYSLIVRGAEPNPSRPPQPRHSAAGPLEVTCWGQSRVKARLSCGGLCSQLLTNTRTCHSKEEPL